MRMLKLNANAILKRTTIWAFPTQNLLHNSVPEEFKVEELSPIPESIVFKDRNLFDAFMKSQMLPTYYNWVPSDYLKGELSCFH